MGLIASNIRKLWKITGCLTTDWHIPNNITEMLGAKSYFGIKIVSYLNLIAWTQVSSLPSKTNKQLKFFIKFEKNLDS